MTKKGDQAFRVESSNQKWNEMTYGGAVSFLRRRYSRDLSNADIVISGLPLSFTNASFLSSSL